MSVKIGLEIHCPLLVNRKLFCNCIRNNSFCEICKGEPGTYPLLPSEEAIEKYCSVLDYYGITMEKLVFERKHYLYPDLPKGYQLTTRRKKYSSTNEIIEFIALEEDPAAIKGTKILKIDYTRSGNALLEFVTKPCFKTFSDIEEFYNKLEEELILNQIKVKNEPLRCDVNITVRKEGQDKDSKRIEIKNLHSLTNIKKSVTHQIKRLLSLDEKELKGPDETRSYDEATDTTTFSRKKETYVFLKQVNLSATNLKPGNRKLVSVCLIRENLKNKYNLLSQEEIERIIQGNWYEVVEKMENLYQVRKFIHLLKYAEINSYTRTEIITASSLCFQNISFYFLKNLLIFKSFTLEKREEVKIEQVTSSMKNIFGRIEQKRFLLDLEKRYVLPLEEVSRVYTFYK